MEEIFPNLVYKEVLHASTRDKACQDFILPVKSMASSLQERNILDDIADPSFHTLKLAVETQEDFWRAFNNEHHGLSDKKKEEDSGDLSDQESIDQIIVPSSSYQETVDCAR